MRELVAGMIVAGYLVAGMHFAKFWVRTRDRLFVILASAFVILAIQRALLVAWADDPERSVWLYVTRLAAFTLILIGIVDKNR